MSESSPIEAALGRLAFLHGASHTFIARLAELATPVRWPIDEPIFREGDQGSVLYLIEQGRVALEIAVPGRGRTTIQTLGAGDLLGWSSLLHEQSKGASARAVCETLGWALDAASLRASCDADHTFGYEFTWRVLCEVSERLKATRVQLLDLFGPPSAGRNVPTGVL